MSVSSNKRSPTLWCTCLTTSNMWQLEVGEEGWGRNKGWKEGEKRNGNEAAELWDAMVRHNRQPCPAFTLISFFISYLVLYALTWLQAGKNLALDSLDPQLPLLICRCFKVPRLSRQRHYDELKRILLLWKTNITNTLEKGKCSWSLSDIPFFGLRLSHCLCSSELLSASHLYGRKSAPVTTLLRHALAGAARMSPVQSDSASQRRSSVIEAHPCTNARWNGLLLNSATFRGCWEPLDDASNSTTY